MPDPFAVTSQEPQPPQAPWYLRTSLIPGDIRAPLARRSGYTPSGGNAFTGPATKVLSNPLAGQNWENLIKFNSGYRNVLEVMNDPTNPTWSAIAQKAQTQEPLTIEDNALIEQVWRLMADELAKQQEEELSNRWYKSQGLATNPEARAFQVANMGKNKQESLNRTSENRYFDKKQKAEGAFLARQEQERKQMESKREALKGPREWMRYMTELGESPTWLGYWMTRNT